MFIIQPLGNTATIIVLYLILTLKHMHVAKIKIQYLHYDCLGVHIAQ